MTPPSARFVALDFLSQVEHDPEAAAVLVTPSAELARKVVDIIAAELPHLPRREIIDRGPGEVLRGAGGPVSG